MGNEIIFDGDDTVNELVDELMQFKDEDDDEVTGVCQLDGEYAGFHLEVIIRKNEQIHA